MKRWEYKLSEMNKHQWAFFYYCKRLGDNVYVDRKRDLVVIEVDE